MKRVALFVLALIAIVIADDSTLEGLAKQFEVDVPTLQTCLEKAELNAEEIFGLIMKWRETEDITEEVKQSFMKYVVFLGCTLEKNGMMVGTKFVVDKIIKDIENEEENISNKDIKDIEMCINSLNDNSQLTQEDRIFGLMICVMSDEGRK